ncbi:hypothetical protein AJ80_07459 [Polytolypa hystricis UAMH7299]|uniref:Uncharacterized protein n=1 Tax=Polytolypa hystricis (strain UAMH7299) TaxID=1447883 RepID=A0A2B7XPS4_POLH7|nr:hypothetical protein AJ80_07459 [Polytolypa hystricis UAMH7299]
MISSPPTLAIDTSKPLIGPRTPPASPTRPARSRLRRVVSSSTLNPHIDSSESIPSEHGSLYDAILASFESLGDGIQLDAANNTGTNAVSTEAPEENEEQPPANGPRSHSNWPPRTLDTISERRSVSTLNRSVPPAYTGHNASSISTGTTPSQNPSPSPGARTNIRGHKIYSFDDLDLPIPRPKFSLSSNPKSRSHPNRSSSSTSLDGPYWLRSLSSPAAPTQPTYPPPIRSPTPPGLPSFGSREAIQFRVRSTSRHSSSHNSPQSGRSCRLSRNGSPETDDNTDPFCCGVGLRRLLGLFRRSESDTEQLPAGAIARADDGTLIRGRFGARQSGHGVGAGPSTRGLETHPFHSFSLPVAGRDGADSPAPSTRSRRGLSGGGSPYTSISRAGPSNPYHPEQPFSTPYRVRSLLSSNDGPSTLPRPNHNPIIERHDGVTRPSASASSYTSNPDIPQFHEMRYTPQINDHFQTGGTDGASSSPTLEPMHRAREKHQSRWRYVDGFGLTVLLSAAGHTLGILGIMFSALIPLWMVEPMFPELNFLFPKCLNLFGALGDPKYVAFGKDDHFLAHGLLHGDGTRAALEQVMVLTMTAFITWFNCFKS